MTGMYGALGKGCNDHLHVDSFVEHRSAAIRWTFCNKLLSCHDFSCEFHSSLMISEPVRSSRFKSNHSSLHDSHLSDPLD
jgi:hypothetical protein